MSSYLHSVSIDRGGIDAIYLFKTAEEADLFYKKMDLHYTIVDAETWVYSPTQVKVYDTHEDALVDELDGEQLETNAEANDNNDLFRRTDGE